MNVLPRFIFIWSPLIFFSKQSLFLSFFNLSINSFIAVTVSREKMLLSGECWLPDQFSYRVHVCFCSVCVCVYSCSSCFMSHSHCLGNAYMSQSVAQHLIKLQIPTDTSEKQKDNLIEVYIVWNGKTEKYHEVIYCMLLIPSTSCCRYLIAFNWAEHSFPEIA